MALLVLQPFLGVVASLVKSVNWAGWGEVHVRGRVPEMAGLLFALAPVCFRQGDLPAVSNRGTIRPLQTQALRERSIVALVTPLLASGTPSNLGRWLLLYPVSQELRKVEYALVPYKHRKRRSCPSLTSSPASCRCSWSSRGL